jgi:hypothetical protein
MYSVNFNGEEFQALKDVLECTISELHSEIVHTDERELRCMLKNRKQVLVKMLENVRSLQSVTQGD